MNDRKDYPYFLHGLFVILENYNYFSTCMIFMWSTLVDETFASFNINVFVWVCNCLSSVQLNVEIYVGHEARFLTVNFFKSL